MKTSSVGLFRIIEPTNMRFSGLATLFFAANIFFATNIFAEEGEEFTIYPHLGLTIFEDDLEDDTLLGIGVGYRFENPWAIEFTYQRTDADFESPLVGDKEIDL